MAIELSPFDPNMFSFMSIAGTAHAVAGQYDKAIELCRRSLRETGCSRRRTASLRFRSRSPVAWKSRVPSARDLLELEPTLTVSRFQQRYPGSDTPAGEALRRSAGNGRSPP
jgi:hypothetical protein